MKIKERSVARQVELAKKQLETWPAWMKKAGRFEGSDVFHLNRQRQTVRSNIMPQDGRRISLHNGGIVEDKQKFRCSTDKQHYVFIRQNKELIVIECPQCHRMRFITKKDTQIIPHDV